MRRENSKIDTLVRTAIRGFKPPIYPSDEDGYIRMDANTNLFGANPCIAKVARRLKGLSVNHYPSPYSDQLRSALYKELKLPMEQIIIGNGSDEIFDFITKAFLNPRDTIALPAPSFVMHYFYGRINMGKIKPVPLNKDFTLNDDAIIKAKAKLTIIASPNNPTGNAFGESELAKIIMASDGIVVIDEAYAEYSKQNFIKLIESFPNLIVTRTFSKAYGLAGLRIGYAVAQKPLIEKLYCVKPPFTVNTFSERVAIEAMKDKKFVRKVVSDTLKERMYLKQNIRKLGFKPYPSDSNFIVVDIGRPSKAIYQKIRGEGILIRDLTDFQGLANFVRITVGTRTQNEKLLKALAKC